MVDFIKGEIIWAKIRGFPWWPAKIRDIITDESKEIKYDVIFIGDNTHAVVHNTKVVKFTAEFDKFAKTKKKSLRDSIAIAKDLFEKKVTTDSNLFLKHYSKLSREKEGKNGNSNGSVNHRNHENNEESSNDSKINEDDSLSEEDDEDNSNNNNKSKKQGRRSGSLQTKDMKEIKKRKLKQNNNSQMNSTKDTEHTNHSKEDKEVYDEIISKMMSYLLFIVRNYDRINLENEDECLFTIFKYLGEYKMDNPIYFLKSTCLGIMVNFIYKKTENEQIRETANHVLKNFEDQILTHLYKIK